MAEHVFRDRREAGRALGQLLAPYADRPDVVVLALPRGGVPVGFEVAARLHAPLDVFVVRKLGVPGYRELAMGAIASGGVRVLNRDVIQRLGIRDAEIEDVAHAEQRVLQTRERLYREGRPAPQLEGRIVILVDDGLATGSTMLAAARALRSFAPARTILAVPTAAAETCDELRREADEVICATTPQPFRAVSLWYEDFSQTSDDDVRALLERARDGAAHAT